MKSYRWRCIICYCWNDGEEIYCSSCKAPKDEKEVSKIKLMDFDLNGNRRNN